MAVEKKLVISVAANAQGLDQARRAVRGLADEVRRAGGGAGGSFFDFKALRAGLGAESSIGGAFGVLRGTGAAVGLSFAGDVLSRAAHAATDMSVDLALGKKSAGEVAEELAKSIPIYGKIIDAGRTFRALVDGTAVAVAKMNAENERTAKILDLRQGLLDEQRKSRERTAALERGGESQRDRINREAREKVEAVEARVAEERRKLDQDLAKARAAAGDAAQAQYTGYGRFATVQAGASKAEIEAARSRVSELENLRKQTEKSREQDVEQINRERDALLRIRTREEEDARREFDADLMARRGGLLRQIPGGAFRAEQQAVRERYAREEASIARALRDPNLSEPDRQKLRAINELLPGAMRDEMANVLREPAAANRTQLTNTARLTGAGDAAARKVDTMVRHLDGIKRLLELVEGYLRNSNSLVVP